MTVSTLFKYGRMNEYAAPTFRTPEIWFSSTHCLNDPFELRPHLLFGGDKASVMEILKCSASQNFIDMSFDQIKTHAASMFESKYHESPGFLSKMRSLFLERLSRDVGIYCLTRDNENILMWSHYAQDHTGYCLEFEATNYTPMFGAAQPVVYSDKFPTVNFFDADLDESVDRIFLTKFLGWSYEQEYRVVDTTLGKGIHQYPIELLKSVTFGLRMKEQHKKDIRSWLKSRGHHVTLYQASIDDQQFRIVVTPAS